MKPRFFIGLALIAAFIAACTPAPESSTPPPIVTEEPMIPATGVAVVQNVEIQILEFNPMRVNAVIRGQLPDAGCTTISDINQVRDGNTFKVMVTTSTDPLALCAQTLTPFEQVVALNVENLPPAKYTVDVNGAIQTFELLTRDPGQFKQSLVDALNARQYETLKLMMEESFMIAYWRSEGTSNTPDQAIEQLRVNLLNSSSPITADYSKNMIELLGADPDKIMGPDVVEANPLFISGLGAQGQDEAVLFIAELPDGDLYWHGLLFAKDGFVDKLIINPVVVQPVDTSVYPTTVKYVLAQKDVRMRSGPGTQFSIIGWVAAGQTAKVTGVNSNGYWWRVICPDNTIGNCWVSADPSLTKPSDEIVTNPPADTTKKAEVQSVEIRVLESDPLQVNAIARGLLPDSGCTSIVSTNQVREGNTFKVTLITAVNPAATCLATHTPFEQVISLNVGSLASGNYIVRVNGIEVSFYLPESGPFTSVNYVMAQQDVSIYDGPSTQNNIIGAVASGQIASVTGISADGNWWRVICPDDTIGNCWVTANPAYTQPTQQP